MTFGTCAHCGRLKRIDAGGLVERHYVKFTISRRAVPTVGRGAVRRLCSGSGRPPRRSQP